MRKELDRTASGHGLHQDGKPVFSRSHAALENRATKLLSLAQQGLARALESQRANTESRRVSNSRTDWEAAKKSMSPKRRLWLEDTTRGITAAGRAQLVEPGLPQQVDSYSREIFDSIDQSKPVSAQAAVEATIGLLLRAWKDDIVRIQGQVSALEHVELSTAADSTSAAAARLRTQFATVKKLVSQVSLVQAAFFSALDLERFAKAPTAEPGDFEKLRQQVREQLGCTIIERARLYNQSLADLEPFTSKGEAERESRSGHAQEKKEKTK